MEVKLAYGQGHLAVDFPEDVTTVIEPAHNPALADEKGAVLRALAEPTGARPLREWIQPGAKVVIAFTDLTRATPNHRLIPWLLEYRSEEHTSELQSLMRISYAVFCLKKTNPKPHINNKLQIQPNSTTYNN